MGFWLKIKGLRHGNDFLEVEKGLRKGSHGVLICSNLHLKN
jgi:hypothetical protein